MKVISFTDIQRLNISPVQCYNWVSDIIMHKKDYILPPKVHMSLPDNSFCNVMPGIIKFNNIICANCTIRGGVKVVSRYPNRTPSLDSKLLLFNAETGDYLTIMDANWITAMRTGAIAAHAVSNLAKQDFSNLSIIGLGNTARAFLLVLSSLFSDRRLTIKLLRYKDQAEQFTERFRSFSNLNFIIVDSTEDAVRGADVIVSCATYFKNDIAHDDWFDEGVLVVPVHTRGFMNCDLFFDKVFADDTSHVNHFKNFSKFKYYAEMTDVINGDSVGRENNKERILAYNIGVSLHDIYFAAQIYNLLKCDEQRFSRLIDIDFNEPTEKFWI